MEQQLSILGGPAAFVQINGLTVPVYEIAEQLCLLSRDVGKVLGYRQPSQALSHLRRRYRQELASHVYRAWVRTTGNGRKKTVWLISVEGCETLAGKSFQKNAMAVQRQFEALRRQRKPQEKIAMEEKILDLGVLGQQEVGSDAEETAPAESVSQEETDVSSMETLPVLGDPVERVEFQNQPVPLFDVRGELFITGEDLGNILGLEEPRIGIGNIFSRHKSELESYSTVIKLITVDNKMRQVRVFNRTGAVMVAMFARNTRAQEVRQWLATLPERVQQLHQRLQEITPELIKKVQAETVEQTTLALLNLMDSKVAQRLGLQEIERMTDLRKQGLTQRELSRMYRISVDAVRRLTKQMALILAIEIKPVNYWRKVKQTHRFFAKLLAHSQFPLQPIKGQQGSKLVK